MRENDTGRHIWMDLPVAVLLLSRLPMPNLPAGAFDAQARAGWAFGLVGAALGALAAAAGWAALAAGLPPTLAAGLVVAVQIVTTGALHEDGLADTADGLWGGFTPARRLEIMKDSAIGTYGIAALILSVGLRWSALAALLALGPGTTFAALVATAALSRAILPLAMTALPPARQSGLSQSVGVPGLPISLLALAIGLAICLGLLGTAAILPVLIAAAGASALAWLALRRIGGQTGDILGATQQIAELGMLIPLVAVLHG